MSYETSYDTGLRPFNHDKNRGKWSSPKDFFFACLGHAFKLDAVCIMPVLLFRDLGFYALIPYLVTLGLCVLPIFFMQSFLGQFSSSGFLSAFRISPLFKGIGYASLIINLTTLTYYAVLGAIPLFYLFHTLSPTIPWSCEGSKSWMKQSENICTYTKNLYDDEHIYLKIPSIEFFNSELNAMTMYHREHPAGRFSWFLMICSFLIWAVVAFVVVKPIESIGKFLRYSCITVLGIMGLCLIRFLLLPGAVQGLQSALHVNYLFQDTFFWVPLMAFTALGPGWGSIITMASYNKFDTNIFRYSLLCFAQIAIVLGMAFMSIFMTSFLTREDPENMRFVFIHAQWMEFLAIPTGITYLELPHIWSILFFGMIILGCLNLLTVQLSSVLTSIFDEHEILRRLKKELSLATVGIMALTSIFFCSNYGITFFETIAQITVISQMVLNLLLLIIVLWVYGRERFQRDVSFMTNQTYPTWMVNIVRFIAPFFIFLTIIVGVFLATIHLNKLNEWYMDTFVIFIGILPWLFVPGYCVFKLLQTTGTLGLRLKRCIRPTDWFPVEQLDRQNYEDKFSETEVSHNLTTVELN